MCTQLQKVCIWTRYQHSKIVRKTSFILGAPLLFCLKKAIKILNFQISLPLKDPLVATVSETCPLTSRKYVFEPGISSQSLLEKSRFFWSHLLFLALEKYSESLNFYIFLHPKDTLVATFNERRAPTSRTFVAKQGISMSNSSETIQCFFRYSSIFVLENKLYKC